MPQDTILRRLPQQARGRQRIEAILDAAEQLFAEVGYDAATTNAIAVRAHTAIGSLYQFFPNKEAILRALVTRFLEELRRSLDASLADVSTLPDLTLERAIDRVLDPLIALHARRSGILRVFLAQHGDGHRASAPHVLTDEIVARLHAVLRQRAPALPEATQRLSAEVVVAAVRALLPLTVTPQGAVRAEMVAEMKRLVRAYLASVRDVGGLQKR